MPCSERLEQNGLDGHSDTNVNANVLHHADHAYDNMPMSTQPSLQAYVNRVEKEPLDGFTTQPSPFLRPIAMNVNGAPRYSPSEHISSHGRAQKSRGKLSSARRQEVQNMRKQGACIRCRMLRKTVC